jgi:hypothetical protein
VNHWKYLVNCPRARTEPRIEIKLRIEWNITEFPSSKLHYFNRLWCRLTRNGRTANDETTNQSGDKINESIRQQGPWEMNGIFSATVGRKSLKQESILECIVIDFMRVFWAPSDKNLDLETTNNQQYSPVEYSPPTDVAHVKMAKSIV